MNLRLYVWVSLILMGVSGGVLTLIFWPNYSYSLGIVVGGSASLLGAWSLMVAVDEMPMRDLGQTKRALLKNKFMRYAIYAVAIALSLFLPTIFDKITTIGALLVIKLLLVFTEYVKTMKVSK